MNAKYALAALAVSLAVIFCSCGNSQPKDPAKEARQSYGEILKAAPAIEGAPDQLQDVTFDEAQNRAMFGEHYDQFAVTDLNQDGTPELIASTIINCRWMQTAVFTCADGKAVLLKDPLNPDARGTFEQCSTANGAYVTFICPEHHIHSLWRGDTPVGPETENHAYTLEGTTLKAVECKAEEGIFFDSIAKPNTAQNAAAMVTE